MYIYRQKQTYRCKSGKWGKIRGSIEVLISDGDRHFVDEDVKRG